MAREYAQIKLAIWADDDWRDLSPMARYLYFTLLTSPSLTHCGVADWRPARIGAINGMSVEHIEHAGAELIEALYLVIDEESEEVLIRSFVRNDGLMKQPKMAVAMASAHASVASREIRGVIVHELTRLRQDFPSLHGWGAETATQLLSMRSIDPSTYPLGKGCGKGNWTPSGNGCPTPAPSPTPTTSSLSPGSDAADAAEETTPDRFDEFWDTYNKKADRKSSVRLWKAALKKRGVTADMLIAAAADYVVFERTYNDGGRYIMDPAKWLRNERYFDERKLAGTDLPQTNTQSHLSLVEQLAAEEQQTIREIGGGR